MLLPVADRWWDAEPVGYGITRLWEPFLDAFIWSNVWHVRGSERDLLVDTGNGVGSLRAEIESLAEGKPVVAAVTHEHFDHIGGLHEFEERVVHRDDAAGVENPYPVALMRRDFPEGLEQTMAAYDWKVPDCLTTAIPSEGFDVEGWRTPAAVPTRLVAEGDVFDLGDRTFAVLHLPGHTSGSIGLIEEKNGLLFTGDTAYVEDLLMADDDEAFCRSLNRLREVPAQTVFGGHGPIFDGERLLALVNAELAARG